MKIRRIYISPPSFRGDRVNIWLSLDSPHFQNRVEFTSFEAGAGAEPDRESERSRFGGGREAGLRGGRDAHLGVGKRQVWGWERVVGGLSVV